MVIREGDLTESHDYKRKHIFLTFHILMVLFFELQMKPPIDPPETNIPKEVTHDKGRTHRGSEKGNRAFSNQVQAGGYLHIFLSHKKPRFFKCGLELKERVDYSQTQTRGGKRL